MADNQDQQQADNQDQQNDQQNDQQQDQQQDQNQAPEFSWKGKIGEDLSKAPSLQKFEDTPEGMAELGKSYVNLEKLLSNEKVPLPKDENDLEGIAQFNKAIGVPESADGYNLPDLQVPEGMQDMSFDKESFQKIMHEVGATPKMAQKLWENYTQMSSEVYKNQMDTFQTKLNDNINALRKEWGDAFAGNVELGDLAISKLSDDQEMGDWLTATLSKNPYGMKFLAKVGNTFAENKIGEFQYKRHGLTPDEAAKEEMDIRNNPSHPYNNENAPKADRDAAISHVNRLIGIKMGIKQ